VATAKANPYAYLKCLFTELPKATTCDEVDALLPIAENRERFSRPPEPCHSTSSSAAGVWFTDRLLLSELRNISNADMTLRADFSP
jgi:hypothetical protein